MVVFLVVLEVSGQIVDPLSEDRDLNFRRARITFGAGKFLYKLCFLFSRNRHRNTFFSRPPGGGRWLKPDWHWIEAVSPVQHRPGCRPAGLGWCTSSFKRRL